MATDPDSGRFGQVEYHLRGFGSERFETDPVSGSVRVSGCGEGVERCLDHEARSSYALTATATDGGGQVRMRYFLFKKCICFYDYFCPVLGKIWQNERKNYWNHFFGEMKYEVDISILAHKT